MSRPLIRRLGVGLGTLGLLVLSVGAVPGSLPHSATAHAASLAQSHWVDYNWSPPSQPSSNNGNHTGQQTNGNNGNHTGQQTNGNNGHHNGQR